HQETIAEPVRIHPHFGSEACISSVARSTLSAGSGHSPPLSITAVEHGEKFAASFGSIGVSGAQAARRPRRGELPLPLPTGFVEQPFADQVADLAGIEVDQQRAAAAEPDVMRLCSMPGLRNLDDKVRANFSVEADPPGGPDRMHLDAVQLAFE